MVEKSIMAVSPDGSLAIVSGDYGAFKAKQPILVFGSSSYILEHMAKDDEKSRACCPVLLPFSLALEGLKMMTC